MIMKEEIEEVEPLKIEIEDYDATPIEDIDYICLPEKIDEQLLLSVSKDTIYVKVRGLGWKLKNPPEKTKDIPKYLRWNEDSGWIHTSGVLPDGDINNFYLEIYER